METYTLFETDHWIVELREDQLYFGRCVVVLKRDCEALSNLTKEEFLDYLSVVQIFESGMKKAFGAEMFNWACLMNNAYRDGRKSQVHWHVRPRYRKAVVCLGQEFHDPNFGYHYIRGEENVLPVREEILREITRVFNQYAKQ